MCRVGSTLVSNIPRLSFCVFVVITGQYMFNKIFVHLGGMVLHKGEIAEMRTGEGKTLVAILPAYLNALTGKGVHVVTVNDYLARRDCEWVGQVPRFLGLKVGLIQRMSHSFIFVILHVLCPLICITITLYLDGWILRCNLSEIDHFKAYVFNCSSALCLTLPESKILIFYF
jgi:hypothetical protein